MVREVFSEKVTLTPRSDDNKGMIVQKSGGIEYHTDGNNMSNPVFI